MNFQCRITHSKGFLILNLLLPIIKISSGKLYRDKDGLFPPTSLNIEVGHYIFQVNKSIVSFCFIRVFEGTAGEHFSQVY
jgi:hypothetical protein